jgi:tRNA dimethylallyltransferase
MMQKGLLNEVRELSKRGFHRDQVSMQGLGYKELLAYLDGDGTLEEAIDLIKRDTRHFAKRQLTWFKREKDVLWVNKEDFQAEEELLSYILEILKNRSIT